MALTKIHNSNIGESFTEMYGLLMEDDHSYGWATNLRVQHTAGGADAVSKAEYDAMLDVFWASAGYEFSIENGHFIITI
jgi:hypothetical protein